MEKIFGIDLGTTNSEIALFGKDGKAEVFEIENGMKYLPSVVGVDPSANIITGIKARNQLAAFPENTVMSIKRKMGSGEEILMGGKSWSPAAISAEILKSLKEAAQRQVGFPVEKVVITVPAYFTDLQRRDTLLAGEMAGLDVVRIINEPTAAALAYGRKREEHERILVYDLGGGTFDISLIELEDGILEVAASDGNTHLGGDDFDMILMEGLISSLPEGAVSTDNLRSRARLKSVAESIKVKLSTRTVSDVREEFIAMQEGKPVHLEKKVTREYYESLIAETLDETFDLVDSVLKSAKTRAKDIDKVLLVGGSTYTPLVFNTLRERDFEVHREIDPTYCVAIGAALQGAIIAGEDVDTILVDVSPHSLGIRALGMRFADVDDDCHSIIIHRNSPIPASMSRTFYTSVNNQREIDIEVYQGEDPTASKNTFIGEFMMDDLPRKLPCGSEVDVTFEYNLDGVVEVTAEERKSGKRQQMRVDINRLDESLDYSPSEPVGVES